MENIARTQCPKALPWQPDSNILLLLYVHVCVVVWTLQIDVFRYWDMESGIIRRCVIGVGVVLLEEVCHCADRL